MVHEVITLGEAMVVLYPANPVSLDEVDAVTMSIGGAESNLAILLSRLGHRVAFLSRVGDDPFGRRIRAVLEVEGVDTTHLISDPQARTGVFFREWLPDGARRVFYYRSGSAASRLSPADLRAEMFSGTRLLHLTGITPALSADCAAAVEQAIELAHAAGALVSFDPNYRSSLWSPAAARDALLPLMSRVDILLMGHEESRAILEVEDEEDALRRGSELGARVVVLKKAERGSSALAGATLVSALIEDVSAAIDPVGAGDAFDAGFLSGWLRGDSLEQALRLGSRLGAATVRVVGDYIPRSSYS